MHNPQMYRFLFVENVSLFVCEKACDKVIKGGLSF